MPITIIDSTLRDGNHAVRHQITKEVIRDYSRYANKTGVDIVVVGHGNGLGASSLHLGQSLVSDVDMLTIARHELTRTKLGAFIIPGFGSLKDIDIAISCGIDVLFVASHVTEANITKEYVTYAHTKHIKTYGVLMMSHMAEYMELWTQIASMKEYGVTGVILMDSAGTYMPHDISNRLCIPHVVDIPLGFHPHNNLGLAVANAYEAVRYGATIIDGTTRGFGAGAGNVPLEIVVPLLHKQGYETNVNDDRLFEAAEYLKTIYPPQDITPLSVTSGLSGVFSGFKPLVEKAAKVYNVNPHAIFRKLGEKRVVAGQEDQIIAVAKSL